MQSITNLAVTSSPAFSFLVGLLLEGDGSSFLFRNLAGFFPPTLHGKFQLEDHLQEANSSRYKLKHQSMYVG